MTQIDAALSILGDIANLFSGFWGKSWGLVASTLQEFTPGLGQPLHLSGRTGHVAGTLRTGRGLVLLMLGTLREWRGYYEALLFSLSGQRRKKACFVSVRPRVEGGGKKMLPRKGISVVFL